MKYQDIIYIAELGLQDDKKKLVDVLKKYAAEASNQNKYSLYQGLKDVITNYSKAKKNNISSSTLSEEIAETDTQQQTYFENMPHTIWLPKRLEYRIENLIKLYQSHSDSTTLQRKLNKILLYGPPGTGKTTLGFYIAKRLNKPIKYIKVSDVISARFGETMKNLANVFQTTKNEIIFIDEFDAFAKSRTDSNDVGELKRIVNSLIQTLDFYNSSGIVIVATNLIDSLDPAILRRFPYRILVDSLDKEEQSEFLNFIMKSNHDIPFKIDKEEFKFVESIIYALNLGTLDQIQQLVDKSIILAMVHKDKSLKINRFVEAVISSDYINQNNVKDLHNEHPEILQQIGSIMENQGYAMSHISELLGIHRNSYKKYAK